MTDLQELPDHHGFEHGSESARGHDVSVGREHEVVQPGEEGRVLEGLLDERFTSCSNGKCTRMPMLCTRWLACAARAPSLAACIRPGLPR